MTDVARRGRRPHAALGGRILAAGLGSAATLAFAALMARADAAEAPTGPPPATEVVASPDPAPPTVVRVVVRRAAPAPAGSLATRPTGTHIPAPAPAPTRTTRAPAARTASS